MKDMTIIKEKILHLRIEAIPLPIIANRLRLIGEKNYERSPTTILMIENIVKETEWPYKRAIFEESISKKPSVEKWDRLKSKSSYWEKNQIAGSID